MRLLLVGWDAADWKVIDPLLARGEMPHLAGLIAGGVRGNIATIYPALSPMLWTSIATGKRPPKHGIHGFIEPTPDGMGIRPVSGLSRKTKTVWNILNQNGKRSIVVGWWPSHPAEPIRGAMVSDLFPPKTSQEPGTPMRPGTVWPPECRARLEEVRVHGMDITGEMLRMFAPEYDRIDQQSDKSVHDLAGLIAETLSTHGAATDLLEHEPWDFAAVYYVGIDHFSHRFMRDHAGKSRPGSEIFRDVVANAYRWHDAMLGKLLELAGPDCGVLLLSDHGFHSDRLLPDYVPAEAAGPAIEHRHFGVFCLRAPGVHAGQSVYGAGVLDIAPTVLHLFGLPAAQDMDGKILLNAFENPVPLPPIPSWDDVPGEDGRHDTAAQIDANEAAESVKQLVDLGYVAPLPKDMRETVDDTVRESRYNLARAWLDAGRPDEAEPILRLLVEQDPGEARFHAHLFHCLLQNGDRVAAGRALDAFDRAAEATATQARAELQRRRAGQPDDQLKDLDNVARRERHERRRLAEQATGSVDHRLLLRCRLAVGGARRSRRKEEARSLLEQLAAKAELNDGIAPFLADCFLRLDDHDRALEFARRARSADPDHWEAMGLEARIHEAAGRYAAAADCAIESLALIYFQPALHCLLGACLRRLGDAERAESELRTALAQTPGLVRAHVELAALLRRRGDIGQASLHLARASELRKPRKKAVVTAAPTVAAGAVVFERAPQSPADRDRLIAIVSGLPRSGTSMMMQMLAAGGISPFTDDQRLPDSDNPRGYLEHEAATRLHRDRSWLPDARGKAVKLVAQLLPALPAGEEYRVVLMVRDLDEVLASQRAMLERLERSGAALDDAGLKRAYTRDLQRVGRWLSGKPEIPVLPVRYDDAVRDPAGVAQKLAEFFEAPFDPDAAARAVDASLRRQTA
jgi:predicted AlkP superfamily phosphohydrolase/phosphomutase/tetratricopeptide (TPR) repeat protein